MKATQIVAAATLLSLLLVLGACDLIGLSANERANPNDPGGGTALTGAVVSWVEPNNGDTDVSVNTTVRVWFFNAMSTGATNGAFSVATSDGTAIEGSITWNNDSTELTFTPSSALSSESSYAVTVGTGATASNDDTLDNAFTATFQTE